MKNIQNFFTEQFSNILAFIGVLAGLAITIVLGTVEDVSIARKVSLLLTVVYCVCCLVLFFILYFKDGVNKEEKAAKIFKGVVLTVVICAIILVLLAWKDQTVEPPVVDKNGIDQDISVQPSTEESTIHEHFWNSATCISPKTCGICGETEGAVLDHQWVEATTINPKACSLCGIAEGYSLGHALTLCQLAECSEDAIIGNWEDAAGDYHSNAIRFWVAYREGWTNTEYMAFALGGQYDLLELTAILGEGSEEDAAFSISVYGDNQLLYISDSVADTHLLQQSIEISDVDNLRIICTTDSEASSYVIVDAIVKQCGGNSALPTSNTLSRYTGSTSELDKLSFLDASATSELNDPEWGYFPAGYAIDGNIQTSWQEGASGYGIGEAITLTFEEENSISIIELYLGNAQTEYAYNANGRPRSLQFEFSDGTVCEYEFKDVFDVNVLLLSTPIETKYIRVKILDVYRGNPDYPDTAISEICAYSVANEQQSAKSETPSVSVGDTALETAQQYYDAGQYRQAAQVIAEARKSENSEALTELYVKCCRGLAMPVIAAGGGQSVRVKEDGTVAACGENDDGQCNVYGWRNVISVAAGDMHTVGLCADGSVLSTGQNDSGQCSVSWWNDIVALCAGDYHTLGVTSDGTIMVTGGLISQAKLDELSKGSKIIDVAAGWHHSVFLREDGTVSAVGSKDYGQCDVSAWTDIVAICAGTYHTVGLKSDGTVVAAGEKTRLYFDGYYIDGYTDVSSWEDIVAISAGDYFTMGLKADGTVVAVGHNYDGQIEVSGWQDIFAIAGGGRHSLGLTSEGTIEAEGTNGNGRCNTKQLN